MASSPIASWQIKEEKVETMTDFIFMGSKVTADSDYSHEIRGSLLIERKAITNLENVVKSRDMTLLTKVRLLKAVFFPVVMYGCQSWTINRAEC